MSADEIEDAVLADHPPVCPAGRTVTAPAPDDHDQSSGADDNLTRIAWRIAADTRLVDLHPYAGEAGMCASDLQAALMAAVDSLDLPPTAAALQTSGKPGAASALRFPPTTGGEG